MATLWVIIVFAFVVAVLAVVAFAIFESMPFEHRSDPFRDSTTGLRRWESPHLD
jgi:predicted outer membrane lipoprotein